jgi:hypothetical protein
LLNRFVHLDLEVSEDDWQSWAVLNDIRPEVRAFLRYRPALLFQFDPSAGARSFPTPRSWEFVSQVLPLTPPDLLHQVVSGCVGEGPAVEFTAFVRLFQQLPDLDAVLANPLTAQVPIEPAVLYALCGALAERCRKADSPILNSFVSYVARMPDEFGVLAMRDGVAINHKLLSVPPAGAWLKSHRDALLSN